MARYFIDSSVLKLSFISPPIPSIFPMQRSFVWPEEPDDPGMEEGEDEGKGKEEERSVASSSSSSSAVFSSLSNGTYDSEEKAFYISDSDQSVASSPSLLPYFFHAGPRGGKEGGGVDEWDEEEGEWVVNEEGEAGEEEEEGEEREESSEGDGLADFTWWEVLGESPPRESEEGGEGGRKGKKGRGTPVTATRTCSSVGSIRRGSLPSRNNVDHLWEIFSPSTSPPPPPFSPRPSPSLISFVSSCIADEQGGRRCGRRHNGEMGRQTCSRDDVSQILIKERDPGADIWDVYMGSKGKLRRRPRWCVYGC